MVEFGMPDDMYDDAEERLVPMLFWELYKKIKGL
jgi:hypothetical protein